MNNIKKVIFLLAAGILFWFAGTGMTAARSDDGFQPREFNENSLEKYRNKYHYDRKKAEPWKIELKERERKVEYRSPRAPSMDFSGFLKFIFWALIIGGAIFLIIQILNVNIKGLIKRRADKAIVSTASLEDEEINIKEMQFEDLINEAVNNQRYRYAVKLLYLQALRTLSDKNYIHWKQEKTNHEYLRELKIMNLRPVFSDLTLMYEYIWYGEFPVDKNHFNVARGTYMEFEQAIRGNDEK